MIRRLLLAVCVLGLLGLLVRGAPAQDVTFSQEFLEDRATLTLGRKIWEERCTFCHGRSAYPGRGPRLDPSRYTPEFVYDRVTNGFRGMPAWKDQYSELERKAVAAFVLSKEFSN